MSFALAVMGATGRMGSTIVRLAQDEQIPIVAMLERPEKIKDIVKSSDCLIGSDPDQIFPKISDAVVVDFTAPSASLTTARAAAKFGKSIVIGTTGLSDGQKAELEQLAKTTKIFWSPNMSIGINVLLDILPQLVSMLGDDYDMEVLEMHHNRKKDAPSGTALRLAECLTKAKNWQLSDTACYHREGIIGERPKREIGIQAIRGGDVVGVHTVYFMGSGESIEVTHQAHSRDNFARGALRAARWIVNEKPGRLYTMSDVLQS